MCANALIALKVIRRGKRGLLLTLIQFKNFIYYLIYLFILRARLTLVDTPFLFPSVDGEILLGQISSERERERTYQVGQVENFT